MDSSGPATVLQPVGQAMDERSYGQGFEIESNQEARHRFREFFRNFRQGNLYTYREALVRQFNRQDYFIEVDLAHVNEYDDKLYNNLQSKPDKIMPLSALQPGSWDYLLAASPATSRMHLQYMSQYAIRIPSPPE